MNHTLLEGNCIQLMAELEPDSVQCIITDIPYGEVNRPSSGLRNLDKGAADELTFNIETFARACVRVCSGSFYVFCGTEQVSGLRAEFVRCGLTTRLCIWEKTNPSPMNGARLWLSGIECCVFARKAGATFNEHCQNTVFRYPTVRGKRHPTEKPVALFRRLIEASSNPGDTILDPCCGSGTVFEAAQGRNVIGMELSAEFAEVARQRMEQFRSCSSTG